MDSLMNEQRAHFSDLQLLELKNLWQTNSGEQFWTPRTFCVKTM